MSSAPWPQWPFDTAAVTLLVVGVALLAWAVFGAWKRKGPRCDKCGYDLIGLAVPHHAGEQPVTCPECGRVVVSMKQATRTRKRWSRVLVALLILLGSWISWCAPAAHQRGLIALVPGPVLVALMKIHPPDPSEPTTLVVSELVHRLYRHELGWLTDAAVESLGPFWVETRTRWPSGSAIWFADTGRSRPWDVMCEWALDEPTVLSEQDSYFRLMRPRADSVGTRADGVHDIPFGIHAGQAGARRFTRRVVVGGATESVLKGTDSAQTDAIVLPALKTGKVLVFGDELRVIFAASYGAASLSDGVGEFALGIRVQLKRDDRVMTESPGRLSLSNTVQVRLEGSSREVLQAISGGGANELARWSIAYVGDAEASLCDLRATRYWSGTIEWKLADLLK